MTNITSMEQKKIKLIYKKSDDYKSSLCTGVFGGINSNGILEINFFLDRIQTPESQEISSIDEVEQLPTNEVLREIQCGLFLDINATTIIRDWLTTQIENNTNKSQS